MKKRRPIGIFDSGYGGLSIFKDIVNALPDYDYVYLGDNARVPYGNRSFETVYEYTWECVQYLLEQYDCPLIIVACNTASAKALRSIQQLKLPNLYPDRKVLGVIRPTTEIVGTLSTHNKIGVFATSGTVLSNTYVIEIKKFFPAVSVFQQACPLWVPLIENREHLDPGANYFVKKYVNELLSQDEDIDVVVLGCTHYPLLIDKIKQYLPAGVKVISQGPLVADSLADYLIRHPEIEIKLSKHKSSTFLTTDDAKLFDENANLFLQKQVNSIPVHVHNC